MKLDRSCSDILDAFPTPVSITTAVGDDGGRIEGFLEAASVEGT